jgi:CDP-diglyceride synthetase
LPWRRELKALAIAFALLSLLFAALAVNEWSDAADDDGPPRPGQSGAFGGLVLLLVTGLSFAILWMGANQLGWPRNRTLWVGLGAFLALMTLVRPWWFWENYRARWLRGLIGDDPTAGLYLVIAAAMIWVGLFTEWTFGPQ